MLQLSIVVAGHPQRHVMSDSLSETVFICTIGERECERFFYIILASGSEPT